MYAVEQTVAMQLMFSDGVEKENKQTDKRSGPDCSKPD